MFPIRDNVPSRYPAVMTIGIIIVTVLIFVFTRLLPGYTQQLVLFTYGLIPARLFAPDALPPELAKSGPLLPFFSSIFLHGNWTHLISNMWALWLFGDNIEDRLGPGRFLVFYLLSGVAAGVVHVISGPLEVLPAIGASGAVAGIMGAYFLLYPTALVVTLIPIFIIPYFVYIPAFLYLGFWFISQLLGGAVSFFGPSQAGGIAWWAHIGGFVTGLLTIEYFLKSSPRNWRWVWERRRW